MRQLPSDQVSHARVVASDEVVVRCHSASLSLRTLKSPHADEFDPDTLCTVAHARTSSKCPHSRSPNPGTLPAATARRIAMAATQKLSERKYTRVPKLDIEHVVVHDDPRLWPKKRKVRIHLPSQTPAHPARPSPSP